MTFRLAMPTLVFGLSAGLAPAQEAGAVDALFEALRMSEMIAIMSEEGLDYGGQIGADLFPGRDGADWQRLVAEIYDGSRMEADLRAGLSAALEGQDLAPMLGFFAGEPGRSIVALEVSARAAMLDEAVEEAARESAAIAIADATARYELIRAFVEANDLIETNVVGAMNANYAFYIGLADGGAFGGALTEQDILADVWANEPEIRRNTTEWVYSYLLMAYQPLSDAEIEAYLAFSESEPGRVLNRAIFAAFDEIYVEISRALGLAASRRMIGDDL